MKTHPLIRSTQYLAALFLLAAGTAHADLVLPKPSPPAEVEQRIGVTDVEVSYSSPAVKDRKIFGGLVPFGEVWRTGANECTKISFSTDVQFAGKPVKAGSYCLFTIPGEQTWEVALSENTKLWGSSEYKKEDELFRVPIKPIMVPKAERLRFSVVDYDDSSGTLLLEWDTVGLPIPLSVDTETLALANIEKLDDDAEWKGFADAASYLQSIKQHDKALELVEKSIDQTETWYNTWLKASILADKGDKQEALTLAKKAKSMGDDSNFFAFYEPRITQAISDWQ